MFLCVNIHAFMGLCLCVLYGSSFVHTDLGISMNLVLAKRAYALSGPYVLC